MDELKQCAQDVVRLACNGGATAADVMIREDDTFSVGVRMGEVETLKESLSRALLLRVFAGKRTANSNTSDLSPATVERLVHETIVMAKLASEDESGGLPEESLFDPDFPDLDLLDPEWESLTPDERINLARRCERAALSADRAIVNSEGGGFEYARSRTALANTAGFVGVYEGTGATLWATPVAQSESNMQRDYWFSVARHRCGLASPEEVGRKAAERALRRLGARKIATCEVPVVFDPLTARSLVDDIFQAVSGDAIYRRSSFLLDQIAKPVASPVVSVVDDARLARAVGSAPFDDEGVRTQTTPVIENGVLRNYLHSAYSARKVGACATGNGRRISSGGITVGPTNFFLKPGDCSPDEIIQSTKSGFYVVELIGSGINRVTGDYSRGAVGIWIENGKLTYPVHEVTIAGNLRNILKDTEMAGNDLTFFGSIAAPTLKVRRMVVSGN